LSSGAVHQSHEPFRWRFSRRRCPWRNFTRVAQPDGRIPKLKSKSTMNIIHTASLRAAAFAAALVLIPAIASAKDSAASDPAAQALATTGIVPVTTAGSNVEIGSYRIHVWTSLGKPSAALADGTWLYRNFNADGSAASGTLVVRFDHGAVSQLSLVSHAVETTMMTAKASQITLVAKK